LVRENKKALKEVPMNYVATQDERFKDFIRKWKKQKTYGWGVLKWLIMAFVLGGVFFVCVWTTTQQQGLMPGGSISGGAKQVIQGLEKIK
jgi:hypothetical protein